MDRMYTNRRGFLRGAAFGLTAGTLGGCAGIRKTETANAWRKPAGDTSSVSFVTGTDRREMVYKALKPFEKEIRAGIRDKQVIIKPNFVFNGNPVCATHPDAVRGLLDFLKPMYRNRIIIAESTVSPKRTDKMFEEYGYLPLQREYDVSLVDLNEQPASTFFILGNKLETTPIQVIDTFLDPQNYLFSITRPKSHDTVVATLGLKNVVMGSPRYNYTGINYKPMMHGHRDHARWLHYNMFLIARHVRPDFTIIDGLEGMQGNGPVHGTGIPHGIALAGPDVLAVDRIGVDLMGVDIDDVGYLNFCAGDGLGIIDRSKIRIIGAEDPSKHVVKYRLHDKIEWQLKWKEPFEVAKT